MAVQFNYDLEATFAGSLEYSFSPMQGKSVVHTLALIAAAEINWGDFVHHYGWNALNLQGEDRFTNGSELHSFAIAIPNGGDVEIIAHRYDTLVVCYLARWPTR